MCTHVEVRSPPAAFEPDVVNTALSFRVRSNRSHTTNIFYNLFILQDESNVSTLPRGSVMSIKEPKQCRSEGRHENKSDRLSTTRASWWWLEVEPASHFMWEADFCLAILLLSSLGKHVYL